MGIQKRSTYVVIGDIPGAQINRQFRGKIEMYVPVRAVPSLEAGTIVTRTTLADLDLGSAIEQGVAILWEVAGICGTARSVPGLAQRIAQATKELGDQIVISYDVVFKGEN